MIRFAWFVAVVGLAGLAVEGFAGQEVRQGYGPWQYNKQKNYYFREYRYKINAYDKAYQREYCVYFKNDARINNKWVYFYNPQTQQYWGRYPTVHNDAYKVQAQKQQYAWSVLPAQYRQKDLYQVETKYWPEPTTYCCSTTPAVKDGPLTVRDAPPAAKDGPPAVKDGPAADLPPVEAPPPELP